MDKRIETALTLMRMALVLLDRTGAHLAAARLQMAIDDVEDGSGRKRDQQR